MDSRPLDLDPRSRQALDFDAVLDWVAEHCRTPPGEAAVRRTVPTADPRVLAEQVETVREIGVHLARDGALLPGGLPSPGEGMALLGQRGSPIPAVALRDLATVIHAVGQLGVRLGRLDEAVFPRLVARGAELPDLRSSTAEVLDAVAPDGTIEDHASAELRRIRRARTLAVERLTRKLQSRLHGPDAASVIRDDFITQRNGRFVIPVRSDTPHAVQGIVHASSSSGATQFVEPLETVELNNELVRLDEREQQEIERLLTGWSDTLRGEDAAIRRSIAGLAALDALHARAAFGRAIDGVLATVGEGSPIRLVGLKHPLLERRFAAEGRACVPLELTVDPADRVLLLSGPNAGGKTVSLKTFGLAVLMAQSAIPLPAGEVRLPRYGQLRADIGDHQSMQADLSTFSAHVDAASRFVREIETPAMFLFDEIGTGTDPAEGAALARALLEALVRPGVTVVATTHQSALKAWAHTDPRAVSAAMEFDTERLQPTYRVVADAAGLSAGLEIARRVGLPQAIVDRARALVGPDQARAEDYLNRLQSQGRELERQTRELTERRRVLEDEAAEREAAAQTALDKERVRLRREFERAVTRLERGTRDELRRIDDERERARAARKLARVRERTGGELAASIRGPHAAGDAEPIPAAEVRPGMAVWVPSLGRVAVVDSIEGKRVRVTVGRMPMTVERDGLRRPPADGGDDAGAARRPAVVTRPATTGPAVDDEAAPSELMLIGKTVDEATDALDRFLDRAALAGLGQVRVIHGHGTGRLRRAVRERLRAHELVRDHRPGRDGEGGDGATVVRLR